MAAMQIGRQAVGIYVLLLLTGATTFEQRLALARRAQVPGSRAGRVVEAIKNYEDLCAITGGQAILAQVPQGVPGLGTLPSVVGPRRAQVAVDPNSIAPVYPNGGPTA